MLQFSTGTLAEATTAMWIGNKTLDLLAKSGALALLLWAGALLLWWAGQAASKGAPLPEFGWLEFWANRYQTLLTGMIALGTAYVAVRPVWRQVELTAAQAAIGLRPLIETELAASKQDERLCREIEEILRQARTLTGFGVHTIAGEGAYEKAKAAALLASRGLERVLEQHEFWRDTVDDSTRAARLRLKEHLNALRWRCEGNVEVLEKAFRSGKAELKHASPTPIAQKLLLDQHSERFENDYFSASRSLYEVLGAVLEEGDRLLNRLFRSDAVIRRAI